MNDDESKFFYNKNRKIKPGLIANKSLCFIVENYPRKMQKFAMSFLLKELEDEDNLAPEPIPKCEKCNTPITYNMKKNSNLCKECRPIHKSNQHLKIEPPPKEDLEHYAKTMLVKNIAKVYNVTPTMVCKWIKDYEITETKFKTERKNKVPSREEFKKVYGLYKNIELAKKYNVAPCTIRKWAIKYGFCK